MINPSFRTIRCFPIESGQGSPIRSRWAKEKPDVRPCLLEAFQRTERVQGILEWARRLEGGCRNCVESVPLEFPSPPLSARARSASDLRLDECAIPAENTQFLE